MKQEEVRRRVKSWMVDAGMSQEQTAEKLDVSAATLKSWLYGTRTFPFNRAIQICDLFGKSLDEMACRN